MAFFQAKLYYTKSSFSFPFSSWSYCRMAFTHLAVSLWQDLLRQSLTAPQTTIATASPTRPQVHQVAKYHCNTQSSMRPASPRSPDMRLLQVGCKIRSLQVAWSWQNELNLPLDSATRAVWPSLCYTSVTGTAHVNKAAEQEQRWGPHPHDAGHQQAAIVQIALTKENRVLNRKLPMWQLESCLMCAVNLFISDTSSPIGSQPSSFMLGATPLKCRPAYGMNTFGGIHLSDLSDMWAHGPISTKISNRRAEYRAVLDGLAV